MKDTYAEVGASYRFFLAWRHASFAGMLLILYGTSQATFAALKDQPEFAWIIPLFASPLGVLLWVIDVRTRDLYHAAAQAGKKIEGSDGGFYTELSKVALPQGASSFSRFSQSAALNVLFLGSSIVMVVLGLVLWYKN